MEELWFPLVYVSSHEKWKFRSPPQNYPKRHARRLTGILREKKSLFRNSKRFLLTFLSIWNGNRNVFVSIFVTRSGQWKSFFLWNGDGDGLCPGLTVTLRQEVQQERKEERPEEESRRVPPSDSRERKFPFCDKESNLNVSNVRNERTCLA